VGLCQPIIVYILTQTERFKQLLEFNSNSAY
jgi:hypothetical protein